MIHTKKSISALVLSAGILLLSQGCANRAETDPDYKDDFPKTYNEVEQRRIDLRPIGQRSRAAMNEADGQGDPDGGISQIISTDKRIYLPDESVYLTMLWVNNTDHDIRLSRRLFLNSNIRPMIFLNDEVQVLYNVTELPPPPSRPMRDKDFWVVPPYGERSQVVDLKNFPKYGNARGAQVRWGYNVSRIGKYKVRVGMRSMPFQLLPQHLQGDPTANAWEGSTLSNVVEFEVRRR